MNEFGSFKKATDLLKKCEICKLYHFPRAHYVPTKNVSENVKALWSVSLNLMNRFKKELLPSKKGDHGKNESALDSLKLIQGFRSEIEKKNEIRKTFSRQTLNGLDE